MSHELSGAEREAIRAAAQWYARLASGSEDDHTRLAWQRWHAADPLHQQAWQRMEAVRSQVSRVPGQLASGSLQGAMRSRRQVLRGVVLLASTGALGALVWRGEARRANICWPTSVPVSASDAVSRWRTAVR